MFQPPESRKANNFITRVRKRENREEVEKRRIMDRKIKGKL